MATERTRRHLAAAALAAFAALLASPVAVSAQTVPTPRPVPPSEPWWVRVAFPGRTVLAVHASGDTITVLLDAGRGNGEEQSSDGGRTWQQIDDPQAISVPPDAHWRVIDGRVAQVNPDGTTSVEPGSPSMPLIEGSPPATARELVAGPAALPGVAVAVDVDNVAWCRSAAGHWSRALLLLPQGILADPPRVTAVVAFSTQPLTDTVYMGTDGYSVLASGDGGLDWYRAGPGLPDHVRNLDADPAGQAVFAATDDGLWVHHLRAIPAPPSYADAALRWRWLGIGLVTLVASAIGVAGLLRAVR